MGFFKKKELTPIKSEPKFVSGRITLLVNNQGSIVIDVQQEGHNRNVNVNIQGNISLETVYIALDVTKNSLAMKDSNQKGLVEVTHNIEGLPLPVAYVALEIAKNSIIRGGPPVQAASGRTDDMDYVG